MVFKERTSLWKERLLRLLDKYSTAGVGEIGIDSNPKSMDGNNIYRNFSNSVRYCSSI